MVRNSLADCFDGFEKAGCTAHIGDVIRVLRDSCFRINMLSTEVKTAEDCHLVVSELIENL